jgi:hypothetical protein
MKLKHYILDADNQIVESDFMTWAMWLEDANRIVGYTEITSECLVSTVFLGLDHRFFGKGPPLLFETMIFGGPLDHETWRYSSWDDAETGHAVAVRKARKAMAVAVRKARKAMAVLTGKVPVR